MNKAIVSEDAHKFIKMLVELGGVHYVDGEQIIHSTATDAPVGVKVGIPPKRRPVAIFKEGMSVGDYVILNPFTDVCANSPERSWFVNKMCAFPGALIKRIIIGMIEIGTSKTKDAGYKANKFVSKWIGDMDAKMLDEVKKIDSTDWAVIFYDRTKMIAQLQSNIGYDELKDQFKTKIRKSSWPIFVDMVKTLLKLDDKKAESLTYKRTIVSIPKVDAILHLLADVLERLDTPTKEFTDIEIPVKEISEHLKNLEVYCEAVKYFASATASPDADKADESSSPWSIKSPVIPSATPEVAAIVPSPSPAEEASTIANLRPVGVVYNDKFGTGVSGTGTIVNPQFVSPYQTYGAPMSPTPISGLRSW